MKQPIPFDLERAKAGDPILCKGKPARFLLHVPEARKDERIIVINHNGSIWGCTEDGRRFDGDIPPCLTMAPKKRVVWVNMYPHPMVVCSYPTKEEADWRADKARIACVRVEFEEGEGL